MIITLKRVVGPNYDEILMTKLLVLQAWHGFIWSWARTPGDGPNFLLWNFWDFPKLIPDHTTVWYFRECLAKTGKDEEIWGWTAKTTKWASWRWSQNPEKIKRKPGLKKGGKNHTLATNHTLKPILITVFDRGCTSATPANVHDSQKIDLSEPGKVIYQNKEYFEAPWKRPFAMIKNILHSNHHLVTTIQQIHTKKNTISTASATT